MRRHLAVAIDVDANVDAAEVCRIEPDLESALAATGGGGDSEGPALASVSLSDPLGDLPKHAVVASPSCGPAR